ncbi:MAG: tripartite tricarboxylate transporter TctB family protein [Pseudomonadota bacterium]|nr:tripartite tricarboxylate transporter TctB family protein [Pseudomonadota bacterium]
MLKMLTDKEMLSGLLFVLIGGAFALGAADYDMGTARRMGPGYFPVVLGGILCLIGLALSAKAVVRQRPEAMSRIYLRPLLSLTASILAFAALIDNVGLIAACLACVLISGLASAQTRWRETILIALGMAAFSALVFQQFLGLPFRLWVQ